MKLYADTPGRRTAQIVADVMLGGFVAVCVWAGRVVADGIGALRGPADGLASVGTSFRDQMAGVAGQVGGVPVVGDGLKAPFTALSGTGADLASAGVSLGSTVDTIARVTGIAVAAVPVLVALLLWGLLRLRFVRRATAASRLAGSPGAMELLALRALTRQPLRRLASLGPDVAGRYRDGDPAVVRQLAALEMRSCGVSLERGRSAERVTRLA